MDKARQHMVQNQLAPNQITSAALLQAFCTVPREQFIPHNDVKAPYIDAAIEIGEDRFLLAPLILAKLINYSELLPSSNVLIIGGGTGYGAAIFSHLCNMVFVVESNPVLFKHLITNINKGEYLNIVPHKGPLTAGFPKSAPYDHIFVLGGVEFIPEALLSQLKPTGSLLTICYFKPHFSQIVKFTPLTGESPHTIFEWGDAPILPDFVLQKEFIL